jgi:hypothetical protein
VPVLRQPARCGRPRLPARERLPALTTARLAGPAIAADLGWRQEPDG